MAQVSYGTITITDTTDKNIFIRYSANSDGTNSTSNPVSTTKYVGIYCGTAQTEVEAMASSTGWNWSEYIGTDGLSVKSTRILYYLKTNSANVPQVDGNTSIVSTNTENVWTSKNPTYVTNGTYWTCLEITLSDNTTKSWSAPAEDLGLTKAAEDAAEMKSLAQHANENANGALSISRATQQNFWWWTADKVISSSLTLPAGAYVSDIREDPFLANPTGGYLISRSDGLFLNYGQNVLMGLSGNALKFYRPGTTKLIGGTETIDAQLDANGLKLTKGGIEAGEPGNNDFIYLSTNNYPLRQFISSEHSSFDSNKQYYTFEDNEYVLVENPVAAEISNYYEISVEGATINGYTPTEGLSDTGWRQIIGDKFGVDGEGNLYAGNAHISGSIEVNADSNVYDIQTINDVIYGVVAYIYNNNGQEEEVYKREDGTYYWIEINDNIEIIHEIEESELERDEEDHLLIIRKADGIDTTVNNIATQLNNAQESISSLRSATTERIDILVNDNNTINNNLIQYNNRLNDLEGYVIINSEYGYIQVGGQNSRSYVKIDGVNAMVSINTIEKEKIAYISEDRFYAPSAVVTNLFMQREGVEGSNTIGEIGWVMRSNGNLSLKRIK